jgi:hypothetical protein
MTPRVTAEGVDAAGYRFTPAIDAGRWQAQWIWLDPAAGGGEAIAACFRKKVTLPAAIAAEVFTREQPNYSLGRPGFAFGADFTFVDRPAIQVTSGPDWSAALSEAYSPAEWTASTPGAKPVRHIRFDASKEAQGWRLAGFDDSRWPRAAKIDSVRGNLAASEIPPRMEAIYPWVEVVRASEGVTVSGDTVTLSKDASFAVRFNRVLSAYLSVKVRGAAGTVVILQPNEVNQPGFHRMTSVILREGITYYEFPVMDSFSTVNIQVNHVTAPLVIEDVRASFVSYPVSYVGSFETSDADLNRLWKASRWATQISMHLSRGWACREAKLRHLCPAGSPRLSETRPPSSANEPPLGRGKCPSWHLRW